MRRLSLDLGGARAWISLLAAIGTLSLAVVVAFQRTRSRDLARALAGLCFALFGWNFSVLAADVSRSQGLPGVQTFGRLDAFFTALSPPLVFEVLLLFVGTSRRHRLPRAISWTSFGVLALVSLGGLVSSDLLRLGDGLAWLLAFFTGWVSTLVYGIVVLVRHMKGSGDPREKARARVVLAALAIGGAFSMSDAARDLGLPLPHLGAVGTLIAAALIATVVIRFELLDRSISAKTVLYALAMIASFAVVYLVVLVAFAGRLAAQLFALCVLTLLGAAVVRELVISVAEARARRQRLALLGRFSAQMAHDIRGPLTALLGAVDVLEEAEPGDESMKREFLGLVTEQAKRVAAIVDRYDRIARIEPRRTIVRVNEIVGAVARSHKLAPSRMELASDDPECDADPALVESAVENVVRNAVEATNDANLVHVSTMARSETIVIRVVDEGPGMDPRVLERAAEDFFTTKENGSGLGLAFARRVLEAHAGTLTIRSELRKGTTVELVLLRRSNEAAVAAGSVPG